MSKRIDQIKKEIERNLLVLFNNQYFPTLITITDIHLEPDLSLAKVYLSTNDRKCFQKIAGNKSNYRKILAKKLRLRRMPDIEFIYDDGKINLLLDQISG
jgi:ribosome-binding factor A